MTNLAIQKLLNKWRNKKAVVWKYEASLGILILRLFSFSETILLEITCINTSYLCGYLRWSECDLIIESVNRGQDHSPSYRYIIRDEKAKFEIYCSEIDVVERNSEEIM